MTSDTVPEGTICPPGTGGGTGKKTGDEDRLAPVGYNPRVCGEREGLRRAGYHGDTRCRVGRVCVLFQLIVGINIIVFGY